jgi:ABC-2 type transport system permease protein
VSAWSDIRLVALREVDEKLHSRTFVLSTLFFLLVVALSIALPALLFDDGPQDYEVAVLGAEARALVEAVPDDVVELTAVAGETVDVDQLLRDGDVDAGLVVADDGSMQISAAESVPEDLREALTTTAQLAAVDGALREAGTPAADVERLLRPVPVEERLLEEQSDAPEAAPLLSLAFVMLFFFVVFQFGYAIAQGVVQEKESRVVELLVSAVPVRTLLFGKVLGNGALALTQIVLLVAVAVTGLRHWASGSCCRCSCAAAGGSCSSSSSASRCSRACGRLPARSPVAPRTCRAPRCPCRCWSSARCSPPSTCRPGRCGRCCRSSP